MSKNTIENESKQSFSNLPKNAAMQKSNLIPLSFGGEKRINEFGELKENNSLPRLRESTARLRLRLCRGKAIL